MKGIILSILLLLSIGGVRGQGISCSDTARVAVYFRQGHSSFDSSFRRNGSRFEAFVGRVRSFENDRAVSIRRVRIVAGASPEGNTDVQKVLSSKRAERLTGLFERYGLFSDIPTDVSAVGIDWEGLTRLVERSAMPYREAVLDILYHTPEWIKRDGVVVDGRKRQLQMLQGGRAWHYMEEHFFPELRCARVELFYSDDSDISTERSDTPTRSSVDTLVLYHRDTLVVVHRDTVLLQTPRPVYGFCMAFKTNLLYDLALVPNLGAEFYLGRGWSLGVSGMYAWWDDDAHHRYWRIYGGECNIRKYFGRQTLNKPLTGHHLGIYGQALTYDFETGAKGYMGGVPGGTLLDRAHWGVGIDYGYSVALGRRLNLDFSIGLGYLGGEYMEYTPVDTHYVWQATRQRHWFGPTKAEISLVWLLGSGVLNNKKGAK